MGKKIHYKTAVSFSNDKQIYDCIAKIPFLSQTAINNALKEAATNTSRGARVAIKKAVTSVYGISATDMLKESKKAKPKKKGKINIGGYKVDNWEIKYDGRLLTPLHFKMSPTSRPTGKRYKVKATIIKGQRKEIKRMPTFLAPAVHGRDTTIIPFQRHKGEWYHPTKGAYSNKKYKRTGRPILKERIEPVKTLSVPQMITNKNVVKKYIPDINEKLVIRVKHYMERELDRSQKALIKAPSTLTKNFK